jgi:hypothetical protein
MATGPTFFDAESAIRIANAVRKVELGDRDEKPLTFRRIPPPAGGTKVKFATWTATTVWSVASITSETTTTNTKVIQFAFPTATQSIGTAVVSVSAGATAMCVNHLAFLPVLTTNVTNASQIVLVMKEGGMWRLIGAQA